MAILKFKTPDGDHCSNIGDCIVLSVGLGGYCKYFREFLHYGECSYLKCKECKNLGKYEAVNQLKQ